MSESETVGMTGGLRGAERKYLRGLAHSLDPVVRVGREGLSAGVVREIEAALERHELVKVRLAGSREELVEMRDGLTSELCAEAVGTVGRVVVLYRRHPDPERRRIRLPPRSR